MASSEKASVHHESGSTSGGPSDDTSPVANPASPETPRKMTAREYFATRLSSLRPPADRQLKNPFSALRLMTPLNWGMFFVAFCAWAWDAFDFWTAPLTLTSLAKTFGRSQADLTWGISLVLMLRVFGAVAFGLVSDRYGRRWPFVVNNLLFIVLELGAGFCRTYEQFLACRALFGVAMGGLYGNATATALEDAPPAARGVLSGIMQQGFMFGYLLAILFARALVNTTPHGWRPLFWFGACPPVLLIAWRLYLPENKAFQNRKESAKGAFVKQGTVAVKKHWKLLVYLVVLMTGFCFMAHGSQDLYPVLLETQHGFDHNRSTITQVMSAVGSIMGGTVSGAASQYLGRRLTMILAVIMSGCLIYPYTFVTSRAVLAAAFWLQFGNQGAWGIIPVHLMELIPDCIRAFAVGTCYQLGNLASSATATIQATAAENYPLPPAPDGTERFDYARVLAVSMVIIFSSVVVLLVLGPERMGRELCEVQDEESQGLTGRSGSTATATATARGDQQV